MEGETDPGQASGARIAGHDAFRILMDTKMNAANFWTAILGLVAAVFTLLAAIGGTAGFFQGGDTTASGGGSGSAATSPPETPTPTPTLKPTATPTPTRSPTPTPEIESPKATPTPSPKVWQKGTLEIPVLADSAGQMADFDNGKLVRVEKEDEEAQGADLGITDDGDKIVLEPGIGVDGATSYARFVMVGEDAAGRDGCASAGAGSGAPGRLQLFTDVEVGSHVCILTTEGRIAEFEILTAKLTGRQRWVEVRYTTWAD